MDIEELIKKHSGEWGEYTQIAVESSIRAALTELAAGYEQRLSGYESMSALNRALGERIRQLEAEHERKKALLLEAHCERVSSLQERIRQLEGERVPEGWKLVPVEPTPEMLAAVSWPGCARTDYAHMLAAAPSKEGE